MAKAITTIRQSLNYHSQHADSFAANHALFNRVVAFYFAVIQAHENVLDLSTKEALTALEKLTHATSKNRAPVMPLAEIAQDVPAMFRRAAINAALGSARSFYTSLLLKVWTGSCWSWIKVRTFGRALPDGVEMGSPALVRRGKRWWLHTPLEKQFSSPATIEQQGHADRNASLVIGQRLIARSQEPGKEKPPAPVRMPAIYRRRTAWGRQRAWHRPKREAVGWDGPSQLFLTNSACHWSKGHALCLRQATT